MIGGIILSCKIAKEFEKKLQLYILTFGQRLLYTKANNGSNALLTANKCSNKGICALFCPSPTAVCRKFRVNHPRLQKYLTRILLNLRNLKEIIDYA